MADNGIRGIVICFSHFSHIQVINEMITAGAGADVTALAEKALESELTGLEFLYSMPGSIGGALRMNARCYGREIGDVESDQEGMETMDTLGENMAWLLKKIKA